jgi:hypothetical protein
MQNYPRPDQATLLDIYRRMTLIRQNDERSHKVIKTTAPAGKRSFHPPFRLTSIKMITYARFIAARMTCWRKECH